jgi:hypothetical protein
MVSQKWLSHACISKIFEELDIEPGTYWTGQNGSREYPTNLHKCMWQSLCKDRRRYNFLRAHRGQNPQTTCMHQSSRLRHFDAARLYSFQQREVAQLKKGQCVRVCEESFRVLSCLANLAR